MIGPTSLTAVKATPTAPDLTGVAQRFEAVFLRQMLATMRKGKLGDDIFGSSATDSYREMADANTADALAKRGAFGLADLVSHELGKAK